MNDLIAALSCIAGPCLEGFMQNQGNLLLLAAAVLAVSLSIRFIIRETSMRSKIKWMHLALLSGIFLLAYFTLSMLCHQSFGFCTGDAFLYAIPFSLLAFAILAYVVFPNIYLIWNRAQRSHELSGMLPGGVANGVAVYVVDRGKPFAFSYKGLSQWIAVSQGMVDILGRKELQAVLLHEYAHLLNNTSFYKASNLVYGGIPLLRSFFSSEAFDGEEESGADAFAIKAQRTGRHLNSAKKKLKQYFGFSSEI